MADVSNELIYEVLKAVQRGQGNIEAAIGEIRNELVAIRMHSLGTQTDIKNIYETMAQLDTRVERIEKRLDMVGEPAE
jgi:archaellum component FlaC